MTGWTDKQMDRWMDGRIDRQMDGWRVQWMENSPILQDFILLGSGPEGADDLWYHTGKISVFVSVFLRFPPWPAGLTDHHWPPDPLTDLLSRPKQVQGFR